MSTAEDAVAVEYVVSLLTTEQRRNVASISRSELLSAVRALTGCQRCGFVEQVLAAFDQELSYARYAALPSRQGANGGLSGTSAETAAAVGHQTPRSSTHHDTGVFPVARGQPSMVATGSLNLEPQPVAAAATAPPAMGGGMTTGCTDVMAPAKVMALLSSCGGSSDLVGLMQFSWKETGGGGAGRSVDSGSGVSVSNDGAGRLALSDSLLSQPRLLRRFLADSIGVMQTLADDVGDCSRHGGYPGPTELASTLARLDLQRCHTVERLAAWGVLKVQATQAQMAVSSRGPSLAAEADTAPAGLWSTGVDANLGADVDDPELALAIHLSLQESGMLSTTSPITPRPPPPPAAAPVAAGGHSPGRFVGTDGGMQQHRCNSPRQQQQQSLMITPRRMQRIPPRPTGIATLAAAAPGRSPRASMLGVSGGSRRSAATAAVAAGELGASLEYSQVQASPLSVASVLAVTEGLTDASVLVDSAAVEALPAGLKERVQHLVLQLVQVQQRRSRLEHACQHSILAAGRKLLLILLQMLWASLRRAAAAAVGERTEQSSSTVEVMEAPDRRGGVPGLRQRAEPPPAMGTCAPVQLSLLPDPRQSPSRVQPQPQPPQPRRLARYEGLLADLAAGLGEEDTHVVMDLGLDPDLDLDLHLRAELSVLESRANLGGNGGRRHAEGSPSVILGQSGGASAGSSGSGSGDDSDGGGWDAALGSPINVVSARPSSASTHQRSSALPSPTADTGGRPEAAVAGRPVLTGRSWYGARSVAAAMEMAPETGRGGLGRGFRCGGLQIERDACQLECIAAREQQAEQLRALQDQLHRCQSSQSELQGEVGRLLDMLTEQRKMQEQATTVLRRDLAQWQAEPGALQGMGAEELGELAAKMEAALSRVRAAQLQAAAERDLLCPVCWERRKGLVFGCGHQTCCSCGEKLAACPICREPVSLRIRVYG